MEIVFAVLIIGVIVLGAIALDERSASRKRHPGW
jgi:Tfp pilus assembly protein PilV